MMSPRREIEAVAGDTLHWTGEALRIIDQTRLPGRLDYRELATVGAVREAIGSLRVRGAPAIGVAAAYGLYLGVRHCRGGRRAFFSRLTRVRMSLEATRPTAVNLAGALARQERCCRQASAAGPERLKEIVLAQARAMQAADAASCAAIGRHGSSLLPAGAVVLTYCNAGALATAGEGTALGVVYHAAAAGRAPRVYACETRPLLQGARLTAWELTRRGVDTTLVCDNMAGWVMKTKGVDMVLTGADRIAANGDTANKIGTYTLAVLAHRHRVPFYIAAPASTFDPAAGDGRDIPVEERDPDEVRQFRGRSCAPPGVAVYNPAFDITPGTLIRAFITDRGIIRPPYPRRLAARLAG